MTIQEQFYKAIKENNIQSIKLLLKNDKVNPSKDTNYPIRFASINGFFDIVKLLLNDKRVDPSKYDNWAIQLASENGHVGIVKLLLKDKRVDPSDYNNVCIIKASEKKYFNIVNLLWKDQRVKDTLKYYDPTLYNELAKKDKIKEKVKEF